MTTELESTAGVVPFGWEDDEGETLFRFPAAGDPAPTTRRVLAMSLYASMLSRSA